MGKDLHALIRLRKFEVDECRRALGVLLQQQAALEAEDAALQAEYARETLFASQNPEVAYTLGAYILCFRSRKAQLAERQRALETQIRDAREVLADAFRTLKTITVTQENRDRREQEERNHREQVFLDEVGQDRYRRRQQTNGL